MAKVELLEPTDEGLRHIAKHMREADAAEVWASNRFTPLGALKCSCDASQWGAMVVIDDEPVAVLGLVQRDILSGHGVPWLLGTDGAMKHKRQFFELSPPIIKEMLRICPVLENYVHVENKASIRWLKWLGFKFDDPTPFGVTGEMFHRFTMERNDV